MVSLGQRLKELREAAGISQEDLSHLSGVRKETISNVERCVVRDPRISTVIRLAQGLGKTMCDLFDRETTA
jgi:transcriptional regulator with XRE-family HTH domain